MLLPGSNLIFNEDQKRYRCVGFFFTKSIILHKSHMSRIYSGHAGKFFQQKVGIQMDTNCVPLLSNILLPSYEAELIGRNHSSHIVSRFNVTYIYMDGRTDSQTDTE